jgi:rare lipoprotein A (peptidoglycan hydrolase)
MHDPLLYEARRTRLLFVVLVTSLGLVAFVAQGSSAGEAEPREAAVATAAAPAARSVARTDRSSTTVAADLEAPATMLVRAELETTTTTAPPTTAPPTTAAPRFSLAPPTTTTPPTAPPTTAAPSNAQTGTATWYEGGTASGCAHLTLPKGTVVTVTAVSSGRQVSCTVDDRGPFGSHIIDLSPSGFQALAPLSTGVVSVRITW